AKAAEQESTPEGLAVRTNSSTPFAPENYDPVSTGSISPLMDGPAVSHLPFERFPAVSPDCNCWLTSPANTGDFGATLRREAVSSRIRASLKSARPLSRLGPWMKRSAGRTAAIAPL